MGLLDSYGDQLPDLMPDVGQNQKPEPPAMPEPPKLRSAMRVTQGMQPDQLANDMRMGKTVGLPADFVAADREAVKQKIEEDNAEQALAGAPATRNHLAGNPRTMALTKDDLPNAARLEAILTGEIQPSRTSDPKLAVDLDGTPYLDYSSVPTDQSTGFDWLFKSATQALKAGGYNTAYGLKAYGHMVAGTDPTKDQALMALLDEAKQAPQANGLLEKMWTGGFGAIPMLGSGMLRGATYGAAASGMAGLAAAPLAGGLAATGVGAPAGAAVEGGATAAAGAAGFTFGMFHDIYMQTSGAKYAELIQQGVDPATAQKTAMAVGGVNAALMSARFSPAWLSKLPVIGPALEKAGAQQAIDQVLAQPTIQAAAKDFFVHVAKDTGKNGVLGASMAVVDQLGTAAAMGVQKGLEGQDLLKFIGTQASSPEFWQHAAESGKNMAVDMAGFAIIPGARGLVRDFQAVERAKVDRAVFEALDENVGQSKLRERMPDAHADLVEAIREQNGGTMPENVYVDPKALREASGLQGDTFYQMLTQIGVDPADFNRSEALDAPLAIPMKDYASRVAGTDLSAKLRDDMKFDPEGMTAREAQAFEAERDARVAELKQQYEQNKEQHDADFEAAKQEKFDQLMNGAELQGGVKMTRADAEAQLAPMFKMAERAAERWRAMGSDVTAADLLRKATIQWVDNAGQVDGGRGGGLSQEDGAAWLYHGSSDPDLKVNPSGEGIGTNASGFFTTDNKDSAKSYGKHIYRMLDPGEMFDNRDADAGVLSSILAEHGIDYDENEKLIWSAVVDEDLRHDEQNEWADLVGKDVDDALWFAQSLRIELARRLGFKTVGMNDEVGSIAVLREHAAFQKVIDGSSDPRILMQSIGDRIAAALKDTSGPKPEAEVALPPSPDTLYQVQNLPEWRDKTSAWMEKNGYSAEEIQKHLAAIDGQMKIFQALGPAELEMLPQGAGNNPGKGKGPIRTNADPIYKITFDASAMCVKRLEAAATAAYVQAQLGRALTTSERMALVALFRAAGKAAPCVYCYVEAPRSKSSEFVKTATDVALGQAPKASWSDSLKQAALEAQAEAKQLGLKPGDIDPNVVLDPEYAQSAEARAKLEQAPKVYQFMKSQMLAAKANLPKLYEEYSGQILDLDQKLLNELNSYAGLRFFSSSDFQAEHVADLMQAVHDMDVRQAKAHAYTKVPDFVRIFGDTGIKIQTSIFAKEEGGKIVMDDWQGMNWDEAKAFREKHANVGTVLVASSDNIVAWALKQPWIDYIIPFHYSGLEKKFYGTLGWEDFTSTQSEKALGGGKAEKIRQHETGSAEGITNEQGTRNYLTLAMERKLTPVFPAFMFKDFEPGGDRAKQTRDAVARWTEMVNKGEIDWSQINPEYYKLRKDYARTDTPFDAVKAKVDLDAAGEVLDKYMAGETPKAQVDPQIADKLVGMIKGAEGSNRDIGVEALQAAKANRELFQAAYHGSPRILNQEPVQKKDLVAAHNLSEQNLQFADKIGGLPVPSIGITKAATPFDGFGNITLIGHKDMVDPSRGVPVFSADAYSARFPEVLWPKVKTKDAQRFMNESRPYFDEFKDGGASNVWDSLVNSPSRDRALEDFTRGGMLGARAMYADQVLGKKVDAPMRDVPHEHLFVDKQLIKEAKDLRYEDVEPGGKDAHTFSEAVKNAIDRSFTQHMEQAGERTFRKNAAERLKEAYLSGLFKDGELTYAGADSVLRDIRRAGEKEVDVAAAEKQLDVLVPKEDPAFLKWAADKIGSMFGDPSIKVGGRKVPMSLENLVDAMSTRGVRGKEKTMTFSGGRLSAEASKQFKSIEEIQAERDRVVSPEEHNADVKSADKNLEAYRTSVLAFFTQKDYRGNIDTWAGLDASMKALADAAKKGGGEQSIRSALIRNGFKGVNAQTVSLAKQALDSVKQAKVDYFEAKPQRGVKLNEFMGAVIPEKTSPEARAILEKNGLRIAEYDGTPEGRAKALDSLSSDLEQQRPGVLFQPAYHGSPYRFDKFTLDHIGSGEGAQAFGYGLYFAGQKSVSEWYRKNLAEKSWQTADGSTIQEGSAFEKIRAAIVSSGAPDSLSTSTIARNIMDMVDESKSAKKAAKEYELPRGPYFDAYKAGMDEAVRLDLKKAKGQLYKVEIPEDSQLLLWDKPLSAQPEEVRKALEDQVSAGKSLWAVFPGKDPTLLYAEEELRGVSQEELDLAEKTVKKGGGKVVRAIDLKMSGKDLYHDLSKKLGSDRAASEYLNSIGIKGIKYLDGTSRANGEGSHNYVIFDDKAVQIAKTYYQELMAANRSGTKGSITFDPEQAVIRLFKGNADFSTLLHETAHYFVREMQNMVDTGRAPEQVFKDLETMAKFAGDLEGVPAQEKLARAFELYLREGKAPSPEMVKPFQRFQAWLTAIYRNVKSQLGLEEVPTEMRGVFDRMLAADDEIRMAEGIAGRKAELESVAKGYLTAGEQKRLKDLNTKASSDAKEKLTKKYLKAYFKALGGKTELEKQARAEVESQQVYSTISDIAQKGWLSFDALVKEYGEKVTRELSFRFPGLVAQEGVLPRHTFDLGTIAIAHGYDGAESMMADILGAKAKGTSIKELTEQKIAAEESRVLDGLNPNAAEEIHNDASLSALILEGLALQRKAVEKGAQTRKINSEAIKQVTQAILADMPVSKAGVYTRFSSAARRASEEARKAIAVGDWEKAATAKQREALNHALVIEAVKARDLVAKQVKTIIREAKAKKLDFEAREQILALTSTYGIGPRGMKPMKPEELTGIRDYFTKVYGAEDDLAMNPVGFFNDWSLNREQLGSYKNLTVSQMNELHALVSALADAGGSEYARMASEATMTRQAQLDKMIESVNNSGYQTKQYDRGTTTQKATSASRDVMASLQRMPDLFRNADGNVDAAPKNAHLMGPNQEFAERLHLGSRKTLEILYSHKDLPEIEAAKVDFAKRFKKQFGERTPEVNGVPVPPVRKVEGMHTWTAESIWCVALNMGNEGNLRTLIQGDGLTMDQLVKLTSVLSERDWKAIQAQWDLLGKHYAETDKVFRKVYNFPMPNRVKPKELTVRTAEGNDLTLPGGYFPIKVDRDINPDIGAKQDQDLIKGDPSNKFAASIAKGHTKERLGTSRPVSLSYEVAHRAMLDQARFIALAPIIKDAQAIYTSPEYRRAMIDAFGKEAYDGILPWLKNIASPTIEGKDHFDNALSKLRHLSTLYILGLNLKSATKQYLGLAGTANKLGVKWTASGLTEMAKWGGMGKDFVDEKSAFMRNREEGLNPELAEINAKARGNEFRLFGIKTGLPKKKVVDAVMVLTRLTDRHVTYSTWLGAYKKGLQELGLADSEAVDFADRIVRRTQMSGSAVDTTGWQRSEGAKRLLTMFMSEAIPKSSRMRSDFTAFKNGNMTAAQYGRSLFYETIAPAVGYTALMGLMGGEDKKSWFKDLFWQLYSETFGLFPLLGGVQSAVEFNKPVAGTPSLEALDIFTNMVKDGIKLHDDHSSEGKARMYKALIDATAYMHGVGNLRRIYETAAEGWKDIDHNKTVNPFRLFIRKPKDQ